MRAADVRTSCLAVPWVTLPDSCACVAMPKSDERLNRAVSGCQMLCSIVHKLKLIFEIAATQHRHKCMKRMPA